MHDLNHERKISGNKVSNEMESLKNVLSRVVSPSDLSITNSSKAVNYSEERITAKPSDLSSEHVRSDKLKRALRIINSIAKV